SSCSVGCDCDRFLELWNLVFMQFNRDESGQLTPLPKPSIDTGMGLERISAVLQGRPTNFDTDLFQPIIAGISSLSGVAYGSSIEKTASIRVIADHIRAAVFMLSEGCVPSNEGRGYVLRRIIRRASRHAKLLNIHEPCLYKLTESVIAVMGSVYSEIVSEKNRTEKLLKIEEENFHRTVEAAMNVFDDIVAKTRKEGLRVIPGEDVARLQQTHGLPLDFAKDIAMDAGLQIDEGAFHKEMESHREKSKGAGAAAASSVVRAVDTYSDIGKSEFVGYDTLTANSIVQYLYRDNRLVDTLTEGDEGEIILDKTPFYGESGGQEGDTGVITSHGALITVLDTKKPSAGVHVHRVKVTKGSMTRGEHVTCSVDKSMRMAVMRNHTATHLLHKALRMVLGDHVKQSGSVVDHERLRFDFTHFSAMQDEQIKKVEDIINEKILEDVHVTTDVMRIEEAMKTGAMALFDEKYGETVRVVTTGDFSKELCGGTHSASTGELGLCVIVSEGSVASGIRRIEALTGRTAFEYMRRKQEELTEIKEILKTETPAEKIEKLLADLKSQEKEIQRLKTGSSKDSITQALNEAHDLAGVKVVRIRQDGLNQNELRLLADNVRDRLNSGIILLYSITGGQASVVCVVTKDLTTRFHAGDIMSNIAKLSGGRGGGKPDMAQGGTKEIEKLNVVLGSIDDIIRDKSQVNR
ncbi:MAG TPA: alanine--tRNA ligase, partial [Thermodesulfovibrionales bacterium]|nr:alanine--tRNA ligase [Thermodesulfovibrionales bacterium]